MSVLELKGQIYEMIAALQTKEALLKIQEVVLQIKEEESDDEDIEALLSEEQITRLKKIFHNSRTSTNLIDHEDVKKKYASFTREQTEQLKQSIVESRMPENRIPYAEIKQEFAHRFKK